MLAVLAVLGVLGMLGMLGVLGVYWVCGLLDQTVKQHCAATSTTRQSNILVG